jgi:hypothetical protein
LDKGIAESVYTSLSTDTGGFRYSNTTPQVLRLAAELMEAGADGAKISEKIFSGVSPEALEMVRIALASVEIHENGRIGTIQLSHRDLLASGATDEDSENLVNFVRKMEDVQIAAFLKERPDGKIKISLRSKTDANVAVVAKKFGGGGLCRRRGYPRNPPHGPKGRSQGLPGRFEISAGLPPWTACWFSISLPDGLPMTSWPGPAVCFKKGRSATWERWTPWLPECYPSPWALPPV